MQCTCTQDTEFGLLVFIGFFFFAASESLHFYCAIDHTHCRIQKLACLSSFSFFSSLRVSPRPTRCWPIFCCLLLAAAAGASSAVCLDLVWSSMGHLMKDRDCSCRPGVAGQGSHSKMRVQIPCQGDVGTCALITNTQISIALSCLHCQLRWLGYLASCPLQSTQEPESLSLTKRWRSKHEQSYIGHEPGKLHGIYVEWLAEDGCFQDRGRAFCNVHTRDTEGLQPEAHHSQSILVFLCRGLVLQGMCSISNKHIHPCLGVG